MPPFACNDASTTGDIPRIALALGGGGARGLAHLGVLELLEAEGIRPSLLAGTSIGGLVGALSARGMPAAQIVAAAREFRFPRHYVPGRVLAWEDIFPTAVPVLRDATFEDLEIPLVVSAVDLVEGEEVVLHSGPLLPAVRATCAVPGILAPERLGGRYLVDGGVMNVLPVDLAWSWEPEVVVAVNIVSSLRQPVHLDSRYARIANGLGRFLPNPLSAHLAYEVAMRAVEVALDRQRALAIAMTGPEVLIDIDLGDVAIGDFQRLDEIIAIGRCASSAALPRIRAAIAAATRPDRRSPFGFAPNIDPVCRMVISPGRARARLERDGVTYYFCSVNCRDSFERHAQRYAVRPDCSWLARTAGGVSSES